MAFAWGFDEEADGCRELKLELAQKIMELRQQGVTRFAVVADCGIGLYAGEIVNVLREEDSELMLFVVTPHENQATKWAPYLRDRYFDLLEKSSVMEAVSLRETETCQLDAYRRIIDYADLALVVYDPSAVQGNTINQSLAHISSRNLPMIAITP